MRRLGTRILMIAFFAASAPAFAAPFRGLPPHAVAILKEGGVQVDPASAWQDDELVSIATAFTDLPALYHDPAHPVLLSKDEHPGKKGEDRENIGLFEIPTRHVTLYPWYFKTWIYPEVSDKQRQAYLMAVQQSFIHEMTHAIDEVHGFSESWAWKSFSGWQEYSLFNLISAFPSASNVEASGYARDYGQENPAEDLATYAEAFFMGARHRDPEMELRCRTPAKYAFFKSLFPGFHDRQEGIRCKDVSSWIDPDQVEQLEVLFASPSTLSAASITGHLLLRIKMRQTQAPGVENPEDVVLAFLAVLPKGVTSGGMIGGGLTGAFLSDLSETKLSTTAIQYTEIENRDLFRYRLKLSRPEIRAVLTRFFEIRKNFRYRYQFLTTNCASMLADQLAAALGRKELVFSAMAPSTPQAILANWTQQGLAEEVAPSFYSAGRKGKIARQRIHEVLKGLGALGSPVARQLDSDNPAQRAAAYARLVKIAQSHPEQAWAIYQIMSLSLAVEKSLKLEIPVQAATTLSPATDAVRASALTLRHMETVRQELRKTAGASDRILDIESSSAEEELSDRMAGSAHTGVTAYIVGSDYVISGRSGHFELELRSSIYSQHLGDPSRFSIMRGLEFDILPSSLTISLDGPSVSRWKTALLQLKQLPETSDGSGDFKTHVRTFLDKNPIGFGVKVLEMSGDRWRNQKFRAEWLTPEVLVDLISSSGFKSYLDLSVGVQLATLWAGSNPAFPAQTSRSWIGAPLTLSGQLSLDRAQNSVVRGQVAWTPRLATSVGFESELAAKASLSQRLGELFKIDLRFDASAQFVSDPDEYLFFVGFEALPH